MKNLNKIQDGDMDIIYSNFDALDISFEGAASLDVIEQLHEGKEIAKKQKGKVPIEIGETNTVVQIGETGASGGSLS